MTEPTDETVIRTILERAGVDPATVDRVASYRLHTSGDDFVSVGFDVHDDGQPARFFAVADWRMVRHRFETFGQLFGGLRHEPEDSARVDAPLHTIWREKETP